MIFGGKIIEAQEPVHGKVHEIYHNGKAIFIEEHLLRLQRSLFALGFGVTMNFEKISESARFVIERDSISLGSLKINFFNKML